MLEARNLSKVYKPKRGVPVKALDHINLKFPERGMIFLLGKSGSGKSTLLNLLGGLDKYDEGEIMIKGVSSKSFRQQHFDSYRNTYVGFIFQEYNVLEEFTVGANIALAIELQGRRASDTEINKILDEVDLTGYGDRKPNELSGGQKQRVAIARALVKNPEIIMADEPTGALDSATGRQVLETLRKLSQSKLVIVVSHDREFAEQYADRIIELADGSIIRDVENDPTVSEDGTSEAAITFAADAIVVPAGYHLTEQDRERINAYLNGKNSETRIIAGKTAAGRTFRPTDTSAIKTEDGSAFQLIKSKLPMKSAVKIGASSLKHKKIRLVFTILLSFVAFSLFALADTFGAYNHVKTCTNSLIDSGVSYVSVAKSVKRTSGMLEDWDEWSYQLSNKDIEALKKDTGKTFEGVYAPAGVELSFSDQVATADGDDESSLECAVCAYSFSGFVEMEQSKLDEMGCKLAAGRMPRGDKNEIAISAYMYESFARNAYSDGTEKTEIKSYEDLIGKTVTLSNVNYTITGIVDTAFDLDRYQPLTEEMDSLTPKEKVVVYVLAQELNYAKHYSLTGAAMVGDGFVARMVSDRIKAYQMVNTSLYFDNNDAYANAAKVTKLADIDPAVITWLDGERTTLGEREIVVATDALYDNNNAVVTPEYINKLQQMNMNLYPSQGEPSNEGGWKVVGYIDLEALTGEEKDLAGSPYSQITVIPDDLFDRCDIQVDGLYQYAVSSMPGDRAAVQDLVSYCYREDSDVRYQLQNSVTYELNIVNEILDVLSTVFLYIGLGFALFAALMLANFISTSIAYKKQEIGILRAIGSRSSDVFRIFFSESFIIAVVNFILSCIGSFAATEAINHALRTRAGILITVLNFGPRQIGLLLLLSLAVAAIASYIPVKRIASKRPIDAIRNR